MDNRPAPSLLYRFNDAHCLLKADDSALVAQYFAPGQAVPPLEAGPDGRSTLVWGAVKPRVARLSLPKEGDEETLRNALVETFGAEAGRLRYLLFGADGRRQPRAGEEWVILAVSETELEAARAARETFGLGEAALYLPWQAALAGLAQSRESGLILDLGGEETLTLALEGGRIREVASLPWGTQALGETLRARLNLRFAGSAIRLLFSESYDFSSIREDVSRDFVEGLLPVLQDALPGRRDRGTLVAVTGLPSTIAWLTEALAVALDARPVTAPIVEGAPVEGLDGLVWRGDPPPYPLAPLLAASGGESPWLESWWGPAVFPLDRAGVIALRASRLSEEELHDFAAPSGAPQPKGGSPRKVREEKPVVTVSTAVLETPVPVAEVRPETPRVRAPKVAAAPAPTPAPARAEPAPQPAPRKKPLGLILGLGGAAVAVAGGIAFFALGMGTESPAPPRPVAALSGVSQTAEPAPVEAASPAVSEHSLPLAVETLDEPRDERVPDPFAGAAEGLAGEPGEASSQLVFEDGGDLAFGPVPEEVVEPPPPPPPPPGSLEIALDNGIEIFLDGNPMGRGALALAELELGSYTLRFEAPGYRAKELRVELTAESPRFSLDDLTLELRAGVARLDSTPTDVSVTLRAAEEREFEPRQGRTPLTLESVPEGRYEVLYERPGWEDRTEMIEISDRATSRLATVYREGALVLDSSPTGARVINREGRLVGTTPLRFDPLPEGTYGYVLQYPGHEEVTIEATVEAFAESREEVALVDLGGIFHGAMLDQLPKPFRRDGKPLERLFKHSGLDAPSLAVRVKVTVSQTGVLEDAAVLDHEPTSRLTRIAMEQVRNLSFVPGTRKGVNVRAQAIIPLMFYKSDGDQNLARQLMQYWPEVTASED
jgi:hypothetical protein